ncbi:MAG: ATP-binding protein [Cyanobacteria bacterium P01_F01_bin.150]
MQLDPIKFFHACDPSRTLQISKPEDRKYYIDFASVRGGKIIKRLERTILNRSQLGEPTCQLFTGHIGCGKSTELRRLQAELEDQGFHVVYFASTEDLDMANVDISDILLAIARQIALSLEPFKIQLQPTRFLKIINEAKALLTSEVTGLTFQAPDVEVAGTGIKLKKEFGIKRDNDSYSIAFGLGELTSTARNSENVRSLLSQHLEPRVKTILEVINKELLEPAQKQLRDQGKEGLVVIVDNLDRVDNRQKDGSKRTLPEYLFVDRGDQLRQLDCHVIYTIPLVLAFSNDAEYLKNRLGGGNDVKRLPMVPIYKMDGSDYGEGIQLLKQMVMARAFPDAPPEQRLDFVDQVFDSPDTLERLCRIAGGHSRNLLSILHRCLEEDDPPITRDCLERAIREYRDSLSLAVEDHEWELIQQVAQQKRVSGEKAHQMLLRSLFVFEYDDPQEGRWFEVNPALQETKQFRGQQFRGQL